MSQAAVEATADESAGAAVPARGGWGAQIDAALARFRQRLASRGLRLMLDYVNRETEMYDLINNLEKRFGAVRAVGGAFPVFPADCGRG